VIAAIALAIISFACAQPPAPRTGSAPSGAPLAQAPSATQPTRVSIGTWAETPSLQPKLLNRPASGYHHDATFLVNSPLVALGPGQRWPAAQGDTWNIHEWRWE